MVVFYLAPLNKLGNTALRKICLENGVDYVFTEMIRVEKLLDGDENQFRKIIILDEMKKKTIYQIICDDPQNIEKGIDFLVKENLQIFEINYNMGCPQSTLCKNECGGGIIKNPMKIKQVCENFVNACKKYDIIPSIKIRIGITRDEINIMQNIKIIHETGIKKVYIHGRVLKEPYSKPSTYDEIKEVINNFPDMKIIGNGDIKDNKTYEKILKNGCREVMIGRAALENPYIFNELKNNLLRDNLSCGIVLKNRKNLILEFLIYAKKYNTNVSFVKSNLAYMTSNVVKGAEFRKQINDINNIDSIIEICNNI